MEKYGECYSRGKCQENTINFSLLKFSLIHAGLEHLWCVGGYSQEDVIQTPFENFIVRFN